MTFRRSIRDLIINSIRDWAGVGLERRRLLTNVSHSLTEVIKSIVSKHVFTRPTQTQDLENVHTEKEKWVQSPSLTKKLLGIDNRKREKRYSPLAGYHTCPPHYRTGLVLRSHWPNTKMFCVVSFWACVCFVCFLVLTVWDFCFIFIN